MITYLYARLCLFVCLSGQISCESLQTEFLETYKRDKKRVSDGSFVEVVFSELFLVKPILDTLFLNRTIQDTHFS